jgi:hypothetical protein
MVQDAIKDMWNVEWSQHEDRWSFFFHEEILTRLRCKGKISSVDINGNVEDEEEDDNNKDDEDIDVCANEDENGMNTARILCLGHVFFFFFCATQRTWLPEKTRWCSYPSIPLQPAGVRRLFQVPYHGSVKGLQSKNGNTTTATPVFSWPVWHFHGEYHRECSVLL